MFTSTITRHWPRIQTLWVKGPSPTCQSDAGPIDPAHQSAVEVHVADSVEEVATISSGVISAFSLPAFPSLCDPTASSASCFSSAFIAALSSSIFFRSSACFAASSSAFFCSACFNCSSTDNLLGSSSAHRSLLNFMSSIIMTSGHHAKIFSLCSGTSHTAG